MTRLSVSAAPPLCLNPFSGASSSQYENLDTEMQTALPLPEKRFFPLPHTMASLLGPFSVFSSVMSLMSWRHNTPPQHRARQRTADTQQGAAGCKLAPDVYEVATFYQYGWLLWSSRNVIRLQVFTQQMNKHPSFPDREYGITFFRHFKSNDFSNQAKVRTPGIQIFCFS